MVRRLAAVVLMGLSVALAWAAPAGADGSLGVGNPGQHSQYALVQRGQGLHVATFSGSGPALGPDLQVDLSAVDSRVAVTANGDSCTRSGSVIACDRVYDVVIAPGSTAGPGPSGHITIRNTTGTATISVDVLTSAQSTLASNDITVSGKIGDIVSVPLSVKNEGPNSFYRAGFSTLALPDDTRLVSVDGCSHPTGFDCTRDYFTVGTSLRVTLHLRILGCGTPGDSGGAGLTSTPGAKFVYGRFKIKVAGCTTTTQTGGGGTQNGGGNSTIASASPTAPAAVPSATALPQASDSPSEAVSAAPSLVPTAAHQTRAASALPLIGGGVSLLAALGALGFLGYRRRHRPHNPAD